MAMLKPRERGAIQQTYRVFAPETRQDTLMISGMLGLTVLFLTLAIVFRSVLPKFVKTGLMAAPVVTSLGALLYATQQPVRDAAKYTAQTAQAESEELKDLLKHDFAYGKAMRMMEGMYRVASTVNQIQDPRARAYFAQRFGVEALIPQPPQPKPIEVHAEPIHLNARNVPALAAQFAQSRQKELDYNWLNTQVILNSKAVLGAKGSGKSFYLALEAWEYIRAFPEGTLVIIDKHYDAQPSTDRADFMRNKKERIRDHSIWFLGIPDEIIRKHWVISLRGDDQGRFAGEEGFARRIVMVFRLLRTIMTARNNGEGGGRNAPPFKIIFDEAVGSLGSVKRFFGQVAVDEIIDTAMMCEFEWRKFWGRTTWGLHSIKKEICGLDSTVVLGNMDLLALGNALADPNTRFPPDIDTKKTLAAQQDLQNILVEGEGFACVYRAQSGQTGHKPEIKVMPVIDPADLWFELEEQQLPPSITEIMERNRIDPTIGKEDSPPTTTKPSSKPGKQDKPAEEGKRKPRDLNRSNPDRDLYQEMKLWYKSQPETPTNDEIRAMWKQLKGVDLTDEAINDFLRPKLEED